MITVDAIFQDDGGYPPLTDAASILMADSGYLFWVQGATNLVTLAAGDKIAAFKDRKTGANVFAQATDAQRTTLAANRISGLTASVNVGTGLTVPYVGPAIDFGLPFTTCIVAKCRSDVLGYYSPIGKSYNSVWLNGILFRVQTLATTSPVAPAVGNIEFRHGTGTAFGPAGVAAPGNFYCVIASFDGTNIRLRINGVNGTPVATSGPFTNTGSMCLGAAATPSSFQFGNGDISDGYMTQKTVIGTNPGVTQAFEEYCLGTYPGAFNFVPQAA